MPLEKRQGRKVREGERKRGGGREREEEGKRKDRLIKLHIFLH